MNRRGFLGALAVAAAAPAIIRTPGLLMPVRSWRPADPGPLLRFRFLGADGREVHPPMDSYAPIIEFTAKREMSWDRVAVDLLRPPDWVKAKGPVHFITIHEPGRAAPGQRVVGSIWTDAPLAMPWASA
jgi:hypothetical protein